MTLTYSLVSSGGGTPTGKPDFTVTAIATAPATLTNGCAFAATVTVRNQGTVAGNARREHKDRQTGSGQ